MPLYDFQCLDESCGLIFDTIVKFEETDTVKCKVCGGDTKKLITCGKFIPFKSGWYEHFTNKPIYIGNKQDLKNACKEYNKGSVYLDDM